ncbi:MAG: alpha/beta hydrolase [Thermovirgaceae bacterium]
MVLIVALTYLAVTIGAYLFYDRLLYHPTAEIAITPLEAGLRYEEINFRAADGVWLNGWYIPSPKEDSMAVLFFHGNAGNISYRLESARIFHRIGMDVFLFDYRGYGKSQGKPSEDGLYWDGRAALEVLLRKGYDMSRIVFFGRSLGGAVAAKLATEQVPAALILESVFTSLADIGRRYFPFLPTGHIVKDAFDTKSCLDGINCPVLVVHSPDDEIIPYGHGEALFEAAKEPKAFLKIKGDHNGGFLLTGEDYRLGLRDFIHSAHEESSG